MTRNTWIEPPGFPVWRGAAIAESREGLRSLRDRGVYARGVRGCRYARPPANGWHPSWMAAAIAEVLSDLDAELAGLEQRRAKTLALKQGMMQELLTGRTRIVSCNQL